MDRVEMVQAFIARATCFSSGYRFHLDMKFASTLLRDQQKGGAGANLRLSAVNISGHCGGSVVANCVKWLHDKQPSPVPVSAIEATFILERSLIVSRQKSSVCSLFC